MNAFEDCVDVDWSQMRCGREDLNVRIFRDGRRLVSPGTRRTRVKVVPERRCFGKLLTGRCVVVDGTMG